MATQSPLFLPTPYQPQRDPWQMFMQAYLAGIEQRRQKEAFQAELEDRKMRRKFTSAQIKSEEIEDQIRARNAVMEMAKFKEGTRGPMTPPGMEAFEEGPGLVMPQPTEGRHAPVSIPGVASLGLPGFEHTPRNESELIDYLLQQEEIKRQAKLVDVPSGLASSLGLGTGPVDPAVLSAAGQAATAIAPQRPRAPVVLSQDIPALGLRKGEQVDPSQLQAQTGLANAAATQAGASATRETAQSQRMAERENKILDDWARDTKDFATVEDQIQKIRTLREAKTPQSDMGLMYAYIRLLDPTSVVREGEYATAINAASVPERIRAAYNKTTGGGLLAESQRREFVAAAERIYTSQGKRRSQVLTQYQQRARRQGLDPGILELPGGAGGGVPSWVSAIVAKGASATPAERARVQAWRQSVGQ